MPLFVIYGKFKVVGLKPPFNWGGFLVKCINIYKIDKFMAKKILITDAEEMLVPDESIPKNLEEKDMKPIRPFEIEKAPFGTECTVFLPVASVDIPGIWKGEQKFSKRVFASEKDAKKEIKKYFKKKK